MRAIAATTDFAKVLDDINVPMQFDFHESPYAIDFGQNEKDFLMDAPGSTASASCGDTPSVAVVIPTFNRWPFVADAIESALAQTWPSVEVVVVDDASTDGSAEQLRRRFGNRIRLIAKTVNGEKSRARNDGIRAATSEFVCMLDSDDQLLPGAVADRMKVFTDDSSFDGVAYGATSADGGLSVPSDLHHPTGDVLADYVADARFLNNNAFLLRRSVMLAKGMYPPELTNGEDREMLLRLTALLPFRFCGTSIQRVRRVDESARGNFTRIAAQGCAAADGLARACAADPQLATRLSPWLAELRFRELCECARAHYRLGQYAEFITCYREMRTSDPGRTQRTPRLLRRYLFSRIATFMRSA